MRTSAASPTSARSTCFAAARVARCSITRSASRFGAALAAGQLDGAGSGGSSDSFFTSALWLTDLAVGAPGERLFASGNLAAGDFGYFLQGAAGAMIGRASYDQQFEHRE